jgi:predicted chitinase
LAALCFWAWQSAGLRAEASGPCPCECPPAQFSARRPALTANILRRLAPRANPELLREIERAATEYGIDTPRRAEHFAAQALHESGSFRWMREIWGPTPQQRRYEPPTSLARRLGNTERGDGFRYRGRGIFQLTGRDNYRRFGRLLDAPLENEPDAAASPEAAARVAGAYWRERNCNAAADDDDLRAVTRKINGGLIGLAHRHRWLVIVRAAIREGR